MCRNHRCFVEATMACSKLGAVALYLNTAFAGPQLPRCSSASSRPHSIYDQEFAGLLDGAPAPSRASSPGTRGRPTSPRSRS